VLEHRAGRRTHEVQVAAQLVEPVRCGRPHV
jgi:hypothetical protein